MAKSPAWQRAEGKNPKGGLNAKGRASAKAQGMNLKPPVKKAEAARSPKSAGRRKSFCGRMCGMKAKTLLARLLKIQTQELTSHFVLGIVVVDEKENTILGNKESQ
jgi:hypothetical protein